jgi:hypothetical protein
MPRVAHPRPPASDFLSTSMNTSHAASPAESPRPRTPLDPVRGVDALPDLAS